MFSAFPYLVSNVSTLIEVRILNDIQRTPRLLRTKEYSSPYFRLRLSFHDTNRLRHLYVALHPRRRLGCLLGFVAPRRARTTLHTSDGIRDGSRAGQSHLCSFRCRSAQGGRPPFSGCRISAIFSRVCAFAFKVRSRLVIFFRGSGITSRTARLGLGFNLVLSVPLANLYHIDKSSRMRLVTLVTSGSSDESHREL